ncbi:MAG TPA: ABC transporter ATP-binding protein [Allosphingosinicella sp.]|jgi:ATP-binding cassette subfamily C protein
MAVEAEAAPPPAQAGQPSHPLRQFVADILSYTGRGWIRVMLLVLGGSLVEGIGVLLLVPLLSVVMDSGGDSGWLGEFTRSVVSLAPGTSRFGKLSFLLLLFALLFAIRTGLILARDTAIAQLQTGFIQQQRLRLVRLLSYSRWDVLARLRHGRVTHALGRDLDDCSTAAYLLLTAVVGAAVLLGQLILAFLISPLLAALIFVLLALGVMALRPVVRRSRDLGLGLIASNLGLVTTTTEFLGGLKLAISQNLQSSFLGEFEEALNLAGERRVQFARQRSSAQATLGAIAAAVGGLSVLMGVGVLGLSPAAAIAFIFILARMNGPTSQIQNGAQHVFHILPAYAELKRFQAELEAAQREPRTWEAARSASIGDDSIRFESVSFSHGTGASDAPPGVFDLSFEIMPGEFVGLTGPSGAGKTTLADLLTGLVTPDRGRVLVGGAPLEGARLAAWREEMSYVSQDPFLFHDTVRRNLLWARRDASEEALWEALDLAGAADLVRRLEGRLEAVVGDRGTLLSGGERQRIALARALLRRPRFLLLDEATSAIDLAGEREILERLTAQPKRPTMIIVAHRAESLAFCERVLTISQGRLCQRP